MESDENTRDVDACIETTVSLENHCVNRHIGNDSKEYYEFTQLIPESKPDDAIEQDLDGHSDDADAILQFGTGQSGPSIQNPCVESRRIEYSTKCFSCAMSVIQFFHFFGDALTAGSVGNISIPEIFRMCVVLSGSCLSEEDMLLLDSVGHSLCALLQIRLEEHQHWSETVVEKFGNECPIPNNDESDRYSIMKEILTLIQTAQLTNCSESNSWFRLIPEFRIDLITLLLHAAAECDTLRSIYDTWTESLEILQAKANDIQRLIVEIDEQNAEFAMQVATLLPD
jgi:hypothetical protein